MPEQGPNSDLGADLGGKVSWICSPLIGQLSGNKWTPCRDHCFTMHLFTGKIKTVYSKMNDSIQE